MIINYRRNVVFIHVPKCAGMTVRASIQQYDECRPAFLGKRTYGCGLIDATHIPLFILRDYFPEVFDVVRSSATFALVRDPDARFSSAVSQHLSSYGPAPMHLLTKRQLRLEVDRIVSYVARRDAKGILLPMEFTHFQRQVDYVFADGRQVVENVYEVSNVGMLLDDLLQRLGAESNRSENGQDVRNESYGLRSPRVGRAVERLRPVVERALPSPLLRPAREAYRRAQMVRGDRRLPSVVQQSHIRDFVLEYYKADRVLYEQVHGQAMT